MELLKGSLQTFLNAFTSSDWTAYPVASCNTQDFYNLIDVYLDAVFFPNCLKDPQTFLQEGWHYELDDKDQSMKYKGVVFNEMKGAYSSPDSVHRHNSRMHLFPDNAYQFDSGGDPLVIPDLTYDEFKDFYDRLYHPSNARIWIYGDDDPLKRLELLNEYLQQFERKQVDSKIELQPLLKTSKSVTESFAAGESDKTFISLHWVLAEDHLDTKTKLALKFLDYLLLGTSASPLYKKLNDSKLGEAVLSYGLSTSLKQPTFGVGLKGVEEANVSKVEAIILEELTRVADEGFPQNSIEAAMNTIEFSLRENNTGRFPRGLALLNRVLESWNYDLDPLEPMKWQEPFNELKSQLSTGTKPFGDLIKTFFLQNNHRVKFEFKPDTELAEKLSKNEEEKLKNLKSKMTVEEIEQVVKLTAELKLRQDTPDSPEDLKCIPMLKLEDLPKDTPKIHTEVIQTKETTYLLHDLSTNEILYFILAMDMKSLPSELLPLVPLFCQCLTKMGTAMNNFVQLTELIGRKTGGISASPLISCKQGSDLPIAKILVSGKATKDKIEDLMDIIKEILLEVKLDDQQRFTQLVLETKAKMESSVVGNGHRFVMRRLSAQRTVPDAAEELMSGLEYIVYIRKLAERVDQDWKGVLKDLEMCREYLITAEGSTVSLTADQETIKTAKPHVEGLLKSLPSYEHPIQTWDVVFEAQNEAFTVPTQVSFVGKGVDLFKESEYIVSGKSEVVMKHVYATWLWDRVRAAGGAYGCIVDLDSESGVLTFASYRDPNLLETVGVYDEVPKFLKSIELDEDGLTKAIVGAIGEVDAYKLPDAKGMTAMVRYFKGITDEWRQARRDELLATKAHDFVKFGDDLEAIKGEKATVVAITTHEKAAEVSQKNPGFWKVNSIL